MMDEQRILKRLAAAARADAPEPIDVRAAVLAAIEQASEARRPRLLLAFAATAAAAAVIVALLADTVAALRQDALGEMLESMMGAPI